jgi:hypothetical protein
MVTNQVIERETRVLPPVEIMEIDLPGGMQWRSEWQLGLRREGGQRKKGSSFGSIPCRRIELVE